MFDFDDMEATGQETLPRKKADVPPAAGTPTQETVKQVLAELGERDQTAANWAHTEVLFKIEGAVATVSLNRKERHNMLSDAMIEGLLDALVELHNSKGTVRGVVVRSTAIGLPLCAGMDVEESSASKEGPYDEDAARLGGRKAAYLFYLFSTLPQYVIGMVQGPCMGAGIGFCCTFDYAICLNKTSVFFKFAEATFGMICVSWIHVMAKVGYAKARMAIGQAMQATPTEAKELGIVHHLCNDRDEMEKKLKETLEKCQQTAPHTVGRAKHYLNDLSGNAPTIEKLHWTVEEMMKQIQTEENSIAGEAFSKKADAPWAKEELKLPKP